VAKPPEALPPTRPHVDIQPQSQSAPRVAAAPAPAPIAAPVAAPVAAPQPAEQPAPAPSHLPTGDETAIWRSVIAELRSQKKDLLASALAHARVLELSPGRVKLGFGPTDGLHHRQVERMQRDAEAVLSKALGAPSPILLESVAADEPVRSLAEIENEQSRAREARITKDGREHPAVQAALKIFRGSVEHIRVLDEENEAPEQLIPEVDEGEAEDSDS
jgi:hypothetical protein